MYIGIITLFALSYTLPDFAKASGDLKYEMQLLDSLLAPEKYNTQIRPPGQMVNDTGPVEIKMNIFLRSISRIDDINMEYDVQMTFRQQWLDSRLKYNDRGGKVRYLTLLDPKRIWIPDVFFANEKRGNFHDIITPNLYVRIFPDGGILYSVRISLTLSCPMDLRYYPMDKQTCTIRIGSYGYTTEDVQFIWKHADPVQVTRQLHLPQFTLTQFATDYCVSKTSTGEYACLKIDLSFSREIGYYLVQVYIPLIFMVLWSWVPFWLDYRNTTSRMAICVSVMLAMIILISGIQANTPAVSYTRSIDIWTGACLTFLVAVIIELAFVAQAVFQEEKVRREANEALAAEDTFMQKPLMAIDDNVEANQTGAQGSLARLKKWIGQYKSRALQIDVISRIAFPVVFILFNVFYWSSSKS